MKKRSVKQKAIDRAKDSGIYRDGFNHGYSMGYEQALMDARKGDTNDNQVDKMDRQDDSQETWSH
jgi:flagellar biosynthesis/type III secretory pathway protein FliH